MRHHFSIPILLIGLVITADAFAQVGLREFHGAPMTKFTQDDLSIFSNAMNAALNDRPDRVAIVWSNPDSGASGSIEPLKTRTTEGRECRLARIVNELGGNKEASQFWFCKMGDGAWKISSPQG